jgi:hypothetical protein
MLLLGTLPAIGTRAQNLATANLADYQAVVEFVAPDTATVSAAIRVEGVGARTPVRLFLVRQAGQAIDAISITDLEDHPLVTGVHEQGDTTVIDGIQAAILRVRYRVASHDRLHRVPLPAPNVPPLPQLRPVLINIALPGGHVAIGHGFPAFEWRDPAHGSVRLAAVPSVVVIEIRPGDAVTLADRLVTPDALSTSAMFALLLLGSVFWIVRNRRPKTA